MKSVSWWLLLAYLWPACACTDALLAHLFSGDVSDAGLWHVNDFLIASVCGLQMDARAAFNICGVLKELFFRHSWHGLRQVN